MDKSDFGGLVFVLVIILLVFGVTPIGSYFIPQLADARLMEMITIVIAAVIITIIALYLVVKRIMKT